MAKKSYPSREERMKDLNQRLEQGIRDVFESERFRDYLAVMSRPQRPSHPHAAAQRHPCSQRQAVEGTV